jgi:hypothetical protein
MLEFDGETSDFKITALHNLEKQLQLEATGKKFPLRGKLRSISTPNQTMYGYISDDHTWVSVELREKVAIKKGTQSQKKVEMLPVNGTPLSKAKSYQSLERE